MEIDTVKRLDELAIIKDSTPAKSAFPDGILLMGYASLRLYDSRRILTYDVSADAAHCTLMK